MLQLDGIKKYTYLLGLKGNVLKFLGFRGIKELDKSDCMSQLD